MLNYDGIYDLNGLCLLNDNYLLAGTIDNYSHDNNNIIIIDLKKEKIIKKIKGYEGKIKFIKFINTKKEKILVSGGLHSDIIFWKNKELEFNIIDKIIN